MRPRTVRSTTSALWRVTAAQLKLNLLLQFWGLSTQKSFFCQFLALLQKINRTDLYRFFLLYWNKVKAYMQTKIFKIEEIENKIIFSESNYMLKKLCSSPGHLKLQKFRLLEIKINPYSKKI